MELWGSTPGAIKASEGSQSSFFFLQGPRTESGAEKNPARTLSPDVTGVRGASPAHPEHFPPWWWILFKFFFSGFVWDLCVARFVVCSRAGNLRGSEDPFQGGLAGIKCSDPRALCFPSFNHPQSCQLLSAGMSSQLSVLPIPIFLPDPKSLKVPVGPGWPHNR